MPMSCSSPVVGIARGAREVSPLEGQGKGVVLLESPQLMSLPSNKLAAHSPHQTSQVKVVDRPRCTDSGHHTIAEQLKEALFANREISVPLNSEDGGLEAAEAHKGKQN